MEVVHRCGKTGIQAILIRGLGADRTKAERELIEAGIPLPTSHRIVWAEHLLRWDPWFLLLRQESGRVCGGFAIEQVRTRAMPGHVLLRVRRFGGSLPIEVCTVALESLNEIVRKHRRILRLEIQIFSRDHREEIAAAARELGFQKREPPTAYRQTLSVDLRPSEQEIFASLGKSAQKRVKETLKKSLRSVVLTDPIYADQIEELQQEALRKTNGHIAPEDWVGVIKMSKERPDLSQVFGLFLSDDFAPENMRAFGWVCNHGDNGEYRAAGSSRRGDVRIPFSYLLVWDMIRWSKKTGAEWFDMGGVVLGGPEGSAFEGISEFKSYFTKNLIEVGEEWIVEPSPIRARIAERVSGSANQLRAWLKNRNHRQPAQPAVATSHPRSDRAESLSDAAPKA